MKYCKQLQRTISAFTITTISGLLYPTLALADTSSAYKFDTYQDMIMMVAILAGLTLILLGIRNMIKLGTMNGKILHQVSPGGVALYILAGVGLLCLPTFINVTSTTIFGNYPGLNVLSIDQSLQNLHFSHSSQQLLPPNTIKTIIGIIKLIGIYGIIRAFFSLKESADGTNKRVLRRFLGYAFGGAICFHCVTFGRLLVTTWHMFF